MEQPIRILHIVGGMHAGGMENFIMNLYRKIDREKIQFDIIVHAKYDNEYEAEIERLGGKLYVLPRLTSHPVKNLLQIYQIVKKNQYPLVVRHTPNAMITPQLISCKLAGAKTVCHSHNTTDPKQFAHKCGRLFMKLATTDRIACSENAGKWMFGKLDYKVLPNAIDIDKYKFHADGAFKIREEFQLGDCKVYGHIANFIASKNHKYLLQIFKEISQADENARFFCLGDGALRKETEAYAKELGLENKLVFTGSRCDVSDFMSSFDVLVFPSKFEGLPLTLIEAQAAGLPCLISDTITKDVVVTDGIVQWESISNSPKIWADKAIIMAQSESRDCQKENIASHGYDIMKLTAWYEDYVFAMCGGK